MTFGEAVAVLAVVIGLAGCTDLKPIQAQKAAH